MYFWHLNKVFLIILIFIILILILILIIHKARVKGKHWDRPGPIIFLFADIQ